VIGKLDEHVLGRQEVHILLFEANSQFGKLIEKQFVIGLAFFVNPDEH